MKTVLVTGSSGLIGSEAAEQKLGWSYVEEPRKGDHICYICDLRKLQSHSPSWKITVGIDEILRKMVVEQSRRHQTRAAS
jgi:NAD(P)-dependent dehydrogenase (short-subunit alcohol dehydrogenase family)